MRGENAGHKPTRARQHRHATAHEWTQDSHILYVSILFIHFRGCEAVQAKWKVALVDPASRYVAQKITSIFFQKKHYLDQSIQKK